MSRFRPTPRRAWRSASADLGIRLVDLARLYAGLARGGDVPVLRENLDAAPPEASTRPVADPVASWYVADILRGAPPPPNGLGGRIAFKTGTSYGYRDAVAVGFSRHYTVAAWLGRPDNAAVPGLVGRQAAAPMLFDTFARLGGTVEAIPAPPGASLVAAADLPGPLRRLRDRTGAGAQQVKIAYPPDGATVDLGLDRDSAALALKVEGGAPPFTWLVNGVPDRRPLLATAGSVDAGRIRLRARFGDRWRGHQRQRGGAIALKRRKTAMKMTQPLGCCAAARH